MRADIDFSAQAAKLKESGAEAVILQAVYREPPRLAEQCHAIGYHPLLIGMSAIFVNKTIELGGKHVEGVIGVEIYPLPTDLGPFLDQYRADMRKYFPGLALDTTNLYGYQKAALFVEALQRAGRNLTHESLLTAIESIKGWAPGWGLTYSYGGEDRRVMSRAARLVIVQDGRWTRLGDWLELDEMAQHSDRAVAAILIYLGVLSEMATAFQKNGYMTLWSLSRLGKARHSCIDHVGCVSG
jgi:branched-chain amino acid transport system substrate-binding protein